MATMKRFSILCILLLVCNQCSRSQNFNEDQDSQGTLRILFVGNSYIYINDLPNTFVALANSGNHKVETAEVANGGWTLENHLNSIETLNSIKSRKWDYVVLQEQSEIPSVEPLRTTVMYPAARSLVEKIREAGSTPLFFLTWAHRDGWAQRGMADYRSMQLEINRGYLRISRELNEGVVPVGYAWMKARETYPEMDLWRTDGSHANERGTYLAACVFYAAIFGESPEGLSYRSGLSEEEGGQIQQIATDAVLKDLDQWNLKVKK